jgi:hypothetical protein
MPEHNSPQEDHMNHKSIQTEIYKRKLFASKMVEEALECIMESGTNWDVTDFDHSETRIGATLGIEEKGTGFSIRIFDNDNSLLREVDITANMLTTQNRFNLWADLTTKPVSAEMWNFIQRVITTASKALQ